MTEPAYNTSNLDETTDKVDGQVESRLNFQGHFSPDPQESSRLLSEVAQTCPLLSLPNPFEANSSLSGLSSKACNECLPASPGNDHQRVVSGGSGVLPGLRLPDENGVHSGRDNFHIQFASTTSMRHSSTSSSGADLLLPCDHSRYPSEKPRKLEGFVAAHDYNLYEDKEPDHDDWLHVPDSSTSLLRKRFALSWRGIANVGFLGAILIVTIVLFVGLPIYTTITQNWSEYAAV